MAITKVTRNLLSTGIDDQSNATAITIDSSENVGIGVSPPSSAQLFDYLFVSGIGVAGLSTEGGLYNNAYYNGTTYKRTNTGYASRIYMASNSSLLYDQASTNSAETDVTFNTALKIDSSGNLLVGTTSSNYTAVGSQLGTGGNNYMVRSGANPLLLNRLSSDGAILSLMKDGTSIGTIGSGFNSNLNIESATSTGYLSVNSSLHYGWNTTTIYPVSDNARDLGISNRRWDDIYATNGTIQTSDRNEKQDIEALTDAETRAAVAAKGLLRKFRWQSAVEEKGDEARIHFGIIAQDLQDAFTAEGLDASDYAMFISTTWWETQTEVAAVEAVEEVTDEEGNVITEAVEAKDAYTRTDTYHTAEEAPEGATERTRLGVRYSELLAFIIAAI